MVARTPARIGRDTRRRRSRINDAGRSLRHPAVLGREPQARGRRDRDAHLVRPADGNYAYKIKKAVDLQFLDFSTLAARRHDCDEELRLNRPLAPSVYLDVVAITGTVDAPVIGGDGPVLEYALKMRQFRQDGLFSDMLARGVLTAAHIDQLAARGRVVSQRREQGAADAPYGRLDDILQPALENFTQLLAVVDETRTGSHWNRSGPGPAASTPAARPCSKHRRGRDSFANATATSISATSR